MKIQLLNILIPELFTINTAKAEGALRFVLMALVLYSCLRMACSIYLNYISFLFTACIQNKDVFLLKPLKSHQTVGSHKMLVLFPVSLSQDHNPVICSHHSLLKPTWLFFRVST